MSAPRHVDRHYEKPIDAQYDNTLRQALYKVTLRLRQRVARVRLLQLIHVLVVGSLTSPGRCDTAAAAAAAAVNGLLEL